MSVTMAHTGRRPLSNKMVEPEQGFSSVSVRTAAVSRPARWHHLVPPLIDGPGPALALRQKGISGIGIPISLVRVRYVIHFKLALRAPSTLFPPPFPPFPDTKGVCSRHHIDPWHLCAFTLASTSTPSTPLTDLCHTRVIISHFCPWDLRSIMDSTDRD